jgi:aspartate aminotransferase-like enzyme
MKKQRLLTPGPTTVPPEALQILGAPIYHHRTPRFKEMFKKVNELLQYVFNTKRQVISFASSGTGAMEAAVCNLLNAGDKAIVVDSGKFGERWRELCKTYGINFIEIKVEWGRAVEPREIEKLLNANRDIKAVFTQLTETSTGVVHPIKEIAALASKTPAVLVVDAVSGLISDELRTDEWNVDVVVSGSQKGMMIPPGLGFISLSDKAWKMVEECKTPSYYFNLKKAKKALDKNDTAFTPALTLLAALEATLSMIKDEGLENCWKRYALYAKAMRSAALALGLPLYAPTAPACGVTSIKSPAGIDADLILKKLEAEHGIKIAEGQGDVKGKIFRIASMGYVDKFDILAVVSALEKVLNELGHKFEAGAGVAAAQAVLSESRQPVTA